MSLVTQLQNLITRTGTEFKSVRAAIGNLANLNTTAKGDLVSSINEVKALASSAAGVINDAAPSVATAYSSSKTDAQIAAAFAAFTSGAPTALDTWNELVSELQKDASGLAALTAALGNRLALDAVQTLSATQKAQGISNLGAMSAADVGDVTTDFVAAFNAAIA
uniref:Tail fiber protein n=1 Tax=Pseudomonas phage Touem01 TaxID=3138548 RepID=A0AAU6W375_9VIRU